MSNEEKILTLHPQGKKGVNILKRRYDVIKEFITNTIKENGEITFEDLTELAVEKLTNSFNGKVIWYVVTVKLDLGAREIIERITQNQLHKLKLRQY